MVERGYTQRAKVLNISLVDLDLDLDHGNAAAFSSRRCAIG